MGCKFKKLIALSMSVFMIGQALPAMNVKADNEGNDNKVNSEIINGDFESELKEWSIIQGDNNAFSTEQKDTEKGKSLKIAPTNVGGTFEIGTTAWEVEASTTYIISYEVNVEEYKGLVSFSKYEFTSDWGLNESGTVLNGGKIENTTDGWEKITYKFTTSENTRIVQLRLMMNEGGVTYFDNVIMTKESNDANILYNADFSNNDSGWSKNSAPLKEYVKNVPVVETSIKNLDNIEKFTMEDTDTFNTTFQDKSGADANDKIQIKSEAENKYMHYELGNVAAYTGRSYDLVPGTKYIVQYKYRISDVSGHSIALALQENNDWKMNYIEDYYTVDTDGWVTATAEYTPYSTRLDVFVACYGSKENKASIDVDDFRIYTSKNKTYEIVDNVVKYDFEDDIVFNNATSLRTEDNNKYSYYKQTNADCQTQYNIALEAGKEYTISFKAKLISGNNNIIALWLTDFTDAEKWQEKPTEMTSDWKEYKYKWTPEKTSTYTLLVSKWGDSEAEFGIDDFRIDIITEKEEAGTIEEGYGSDIGYNKTPGLVINTDTYVWNWATGYNKIMEEGKTYNFGFWYKTENVGDDFSFVPVVNNHNGSRIELCTAITTENDWTYVSGEFTAPTYNENVGIRIGFERKGQGTVYFSGLTLTEKKNVHIHHGHHIDKDEPTCNKEGKREYVCDECGGHVYYDGIAKTEHDFSIKVKTVDSTYTEKGYTEYKCKHCNETEKRDWTEVKKKPVETTQAPAKIKKPAQVKNVKLTAKKKSLKITWKKISNVKKYQVQICTSKKFKKGVVSKTASKNLLTVKKLKAKKKYYVRVRAINTSGKQTVYGNWSKVANKKTK